MKIRIVRDARGRGCWRISNSGIPNHFYLMDSIEAGRIIKRYHRAKARNA